MNLRNILMSWRRKLAGLWPRQSAATQPSTQPAKPEQTPVVSSDFCRAVAAYADSMRPQYEATLQRVVDIPSVSVEPDRKGEVLRLAQTAVELLTSIGFTAEAVPTSGNPVVVGRYVANPAFPTVTIYNHLDVQPADPSEWRTDPFKLTIEDGVYRGRGSTDDKGPAMAAYFAAKFAVENKIPININFVWELEEEIGSPSFDEFLKANQARLKSDCVVVADTIWVSRECPAIAYGLRGLQGFLFRLTTGAKAVHSGTTGGVARNPIGELCDLIDECYDAKTGRINIPGIYDNVRPCSAAELDNFVRSGFDIEAFRKAHELTSLRTTDVRDAAKRIWAMPTFEVHGIKGGYTGPDIKTIVPHTAEAKISLRLVPDQTPEEVVKLVVDFVKAKNPDVEVVVLDGLRPYLGEFTGPYFTAANHAMKLAFDKEAAYTREGGSIGAALSMNETLAAPVVFLGLSLPEHGYHAINENFDWQQAGGGIRMFIHYFNLLAQAKR
jgi:acetylornithine deacetylase/succinyl-diaminopimelate desuccinylase-like protein